MLKPLDTPILLIGFNRPDLTDRVLGQIKKVKPKKLYFAVDGKRNEMDHVRVEMVKKLIDKIEWKCEVKTNFAKKNYGCARGPVRAMNWLFKNEERGIILEDDVLVDVSFFYFADKLLEKYKRDERVGSISGNNFHFGWRNSNRSYYFSRYSHSCGWATWRRAWKKYDVKIDKWPKNRQILKTVFDNWRDRWYWQLIFDGIKTGEISSAWDYQWNYMMWSNKMLGIIPNQNLVSNIGFGRADATHTKFKSKFEKMKVFPVKFPLKHPTRVVENAEADARTQKQNYVLWKELGMKLIRRWNLINGIIRSKVN